MRPQIKAALVLVAFKRSESLEKVLKALSNSLIPEYQEIIFVQQGNVQEVTALIQEFHSLPARHLRFERKEAKSSQQAINLNIHAGISEAFRSPEIEFVTVLEDDILVSQDFLTFNVNMYFQHNSDPAFRGVNGFSGIPRNLENHSTYSKQRFGLGWGWSISRKIWEKMNRFWSGEENFHWDGLVESFCKSGYVIMPSQSRVLNLGFGKDATHTSNSNEVRIIESRLEESFVGGFSSNSNFAEVHEPQNWRSDCLPYIKSNTIKGKIIQEAYELQQLARIKPGDRRAEVFLKSKFLGRIQRIIEVIGKTTNSH